MARLESHLYSNIFNGKKHKITRYAYFVNEGIIFVLQMVHYVSTSTLVYQVRTNSNRSNPDPFGLLLRKAGNMGDVRTCPVSQILFIFSNFFVRIKLFYNLTHVINTNQLPYFFFLNITSSIKYFLTCQSSGD